MGLQFSVWLHFVSHTRLHKGGSCFQPFKGYLVIWKQLDFLKLVLMGHLCSNLLVPNGLCKPWRFIDAAQMLPAVGERRWYCEAVEAALPARLPCQENWCGADGPKLDGKLRQVARKQLKCSPKVSNDGSFSVVASFYLCVSILIFRNFLNRDIAPDPEKHIPVAFFFCQRIAVQENMGSFKLNTTKVDLCSDLHLRGDCD